MAELTDAAIDLALDRGRRLDAKKPRAVRASFDPETGKVTVDLTNDCAFSFPPRLVQGLEAATNEDLIDVEVLPQGRGLHWEGMDVDVSLPGLLNGVFGTRAYMARLTGKTTSPAKAAAARASGTKGGRPRKKVAD
jgi:Protein of unknown function (DUF2442)